MAIKVGVVLFFVGLLGTLAFGQARTPFTRPAYVTTPGSISTSASGDQFVCTATTSVCEVESSIDATTMTSTVPAFDIGPTATPGANDKLACFSYGASGSKTRVACVDTEGDLNARVFQSTAVSAGTAFACTAVGCRVSLGNTGRYLTDDGTNLEFVAPLKATTFESTTASGSTLTGGGASGPLLITSNTPDSHTTTTVPAVLLKAANALTTGDSPFAIQDSSGADVFRVRGGGATISSQVIAGGGAGRFSGDTLTNFSGMLSLETWRSTLSDVVGVALGSFDPLTGDLSKVLSIRNGGNFGTEVAAFSKDGLLRVNAANAAKPTCNSDNRGRLYYLDGANLVADIMQVCMKDSSNNYDWETVASP